jgi:NAD(P)H-dependent FMN reductase
MENRLKVVAISGSLRNNSSATCILKHIIALFPETVDLILYEGISKVPHFDDSENISVEVTSFRNLLREADGVIICQPEYAFGVAGSLKNALDWTVGSGELTGKPVALVTAATGGDKAHAALLLILKALSSKVAEDATLLIPFVKTKLNNKGEIINPEIIQSLNLVVNSLVKTIYEVQIEKSLQE